MTTTCWSQLRCSAPNSEGSGAQKHRIVKLSKHLRIYYTECWWWGMGSAALGWFKFLTYPHYTYLKKLSINLIMRSQSAAPRWQNSRHFAACSEGYIVRHTIIWHERMYIYLSVDIMLLEAIRILNDLGIESVQRRTLGISLDINRGYCTSCRYIRQNRTC